ncbi:MAG: LamG domain-containing protein [Bacteroidetes bacterium]|nr:LamG domain-containing protein [Bacteroidota bacterium]
MVQLYRRQQPDFRNGSGRRTSAFYMQSNATLPMNQWTHVAVTRAGTALTLYINGETDLVTNDVLVRNITTGNNIGRIGGWPDFGLNYFEGSIDEVRVWNVAKTLAQIKQTRVAYVYGAANLTTYYTFDQERPVE